MSNLPKYGQVGLEEVVSQFSPVNKVVMTDIGRSSSHTQGMSPSRRQKRNLASSPVAGGVVHSGIGTPLHQDSID